MTARITLITILLQGVFGFALLAKPIAGDKALDFSPELLKSLRKLVHTEIDDRETASIGDGTVRRIHAYAGTARTHDIEFGYELFPELGVFRVLQFTEIAPDAWLYISCGKVDPKNIVKASDDGQLSVDEGVRNKILACASGILYRDITGLSLSCRRLNDHSLYSQEVVWMPSKVGAVQILLDPQHKVVAITSDSRWRSAERE